MSAAVIARRRSQREARIALAREWAQRAGPQLCAETFVVVGSVARGDFNKWSDIDVLIVADGLPPHLLDRLALLAATSRPPGIEALLLTPAELAARRAKGNDPLVREAYEVGVVVFGRLSN